MPEVRKVVKVDEPAKNVLEEGELANTLSQVRKRYGDNSVLVARAIPQPDRISTGSFTMDLALLGGIPSNRVTMVSGDRSSGKTMLSSLIAGAAQRMYPDQTPVWLDIEGVADATWMGKLGVDIDRLPIIPCETGEMACDIADAVMGSCETSLVVVDSIAALTPMKEVESSSDDAHVALQAKLIGTFVRKVTSTLIRERKRNHFVTVLFLNQFRTKIMGYGDPRVLPGGRALEYCTSVQLIMKNKEKEGKDTDGTENVEYNEHSYTIQKNKLNPGPRTGEFILVRGNNHESRLEPGQIDDSSTLLSFAKRLNLYGGGGKRWTLEFDDIKYTFGKSEEAINTLRQDRELYWNLRTKIIRLQAIKLGMPDEFVERIQ